MLEWLKAFLKRHVIDRVPPDLARCEFGCKKLQCEHDEWANCKKRIAEMEDALLAEETSYQATSTTNT